MSGRVLRFLCCCSFVSAGWDFTSSIALAVEILPHLPVSLPRCAIAVDPTE